MEPEDEDHPWPSIRELALRKGKHDPNLSMSDRLLGRGVRGAPLKARLSSPIVFWREGATARSLGYFFALMPSMSQNWEVKLPWARAANWVEGGYLPTVPMDPWGAVYIY